MARTFELHREVVETFEEGWGVHFEPIYDWSDRPDTEPSAISEVVPMMARLDAAGARLIAGQWCVKPYDPSTLKEEMGYIPLANFRKLDDLATDDTHDLRARWFETEDQAREHIRYTMDRWQHPQPWESFIDVS